MQLKRNLLSVALASATMMLAAGAHAQSSDVQAQDAGTTDAAARAAAKKKKDEAVDLDKVVVTGIRRGIENAIETKQTATSIVESVSAEDIGKLPDSSIAESIARLPGLTAQRERGRATQINIRGFAGDFAATTLNGREQASTGDNRGVEFDQYPSELLSAVVVYKTPDASLVGQGLSGTVDLKTVRPLSFNERVFNVNARYDQNKIRDQKENGNRVSFSYIDQFLDNTLGLTLGVSHLDSPQPGFQNETWGYTGGPNNTTVMGGGKIYKFDDNNKRDGVLATLQYKPNEFYEGTLDWFYSKFKKTEVKTGIEFGTAWGSGILQPGYTANDQGTITHSAWTNVKPVIRMDSNPINDRLNSIGFNNKFKLNEDWSLGADLSVSNVDRKFRVLETYAGVKANGGATTLDVALDPSGQFNNFTFGTDFSDPNSLQLIDAGGWGQDGYVKDFEVTDRLKSLRVNATRSFAEGAFSSIDFGVNYTKRTKEKSSIEAKLCLVACAGGDSAAFPGTAGAFDFSGLDQLAMYDADSLLDSGLYNLVYNYHKDIAAKNWTVDEKLTTFYVQSNIDTDLGAMPLRGNLGVQYVRTNQGSEGFSTFSGNPAGTADSDGDSYANVLPSLNLSLGVAPDAYLRFAAARQMARPRMDDMKAGMDVGICDSCAGGPIWSAGGGNPRLRPWLANAYDLSFEKYFTTESGNKGYVSAAYFFKDLRSYIYRQDVPFDFAGFPLPPPTAGQTNYPTTTAGKINQPANGQGGTIKGTELTVSVPLDLFWQPLNGFGVQATYSDTKSSIHPNGPGTSEPLPGLSKYVSNATAYYEHNGFSIRYSRRTRSAFRGETRGFGADLSIVNIAPETVQDAQVNYAFNNGRFKGLSLYLQVSNIGDRPFATYDSGDPAARPVAYFEYGRTTLLGFSYKF